MKIKRALLSVWNKDGIVDLARFLFKNSIEIFSTGGTKKILEESGVQVTAIGDFTGSGSVMDGRVKTLHPKIFGGILADRNNNSHLNDLNKINGLAIDLVVVNFYPFVNEAVLKKLNFKDAIEYIDIGGPSMIRAAAKNYHSVLALSSPEKYMEFINTFKNNNGNIPLEYRQELATDVFKTTAQYEFDIYNYFKSKKNKLNDSFLININKVSDLRYGENPHQNAAFYINNNSSQSWHQYQGKSLSYNNYADMESAFIIPSEFEEISCVIIKHSNPCGFATGKTVKEAYKRAVSSDPVSYFGGIVGFNREVDMETANELIQPFLECIIAPSYSEEALLILKNKKNLRVVSANIEDINDELSIKSVAGGYLCQTKDKQQEELNNLTIVTRRKPTNYELDSLRLGWKLVRHVKSNAIVFSNNQQLIGVGAGQMSRIDSVKIAIQKMGETNLNFDGVIMASDAFFPFPDSIELASKAGISAIIQPGGSIKDDKVIKKADELNISMVFTGIRHFFH